jgi:hypothetical protein
MAKRRGKKKKPLRALPVDLSRMAGAPMTAVRAHAQEAALTAVSVFDTRTAEKFVASGKSVAPMGTTIKLEDKGVTIRHGVSSKAPSIRAFSVTPGLDVPTTGADKRRVTVEGWRGRPIEVPRGFIWNGTIFMRAETGRGIAPAKDWIIRAGGCPSPAAMLGASANDVISAETAKLLEGLDAYGKDSE